MPSPGHNPYEAPHSHPALAASGRPGADGQRQRLRKFRSQMHALGGLWLLLGSLRVVAIVMQWHEFTRQQPFTAPRLVISFLPLVMLPLGIATCLKMMAGVRMGLWLFLALLLSAVPRIGMQEMLVLGVVAFFVLRQAVSVMALARALQAAGIPLTTHPNSLPPEQRAHRDAAAASSNSSKV